LKEKTKISTFIDWLVSILDETKVHSVEDLEDKTKEFFEIVTQLNDMYPMWKNLVNGEKMHKKSLLANKSSLEEKKQKLAIEEENSAISALFSHAIECFNVLVDLHTSTTNPTNWVIPKEKSRGKKLGECINEYIHLLNIWNAEKGKRGTGYI